MLTSLATITFSGTVPLYEVLKGKGVSVCEHNGRLLVFWCNDAEFKAPYIPNSQSVKEKFK